ncbi:hypothetical protein [Saccharospirillum alexandrii]|uniref:hypothetical protein n=1 Tax=Saccharospirillum alexandrii TaxID=2448477 RepID=UPI000FD7B237|nr:hypothetical protein [Saccharospirillum alexandrii]
MGLPRDQREYWESYQKAIGQGLSDLFYEAFYFDNQLIIDKLPGLCPIEQSNRYIGIDHG